MKRNILFFLIALINIAWCWAKDFHKDWLIDGQGYKAKVEIKDSILCLENGLVSRKFTLPPYVATVGLENRMTGNEELRAVRPEALLTIDGRDYPVGGFMNSRYKIFFQKISCRKCRSVIPLLYVPAIKSVKR